MKRTDHSDGRVNKLLRLKLFAIRNGRGVGAASGGGPSGQDHLLPSGGLALAPIGDHSGERGRTNSILSAEGSQEHLSIAGPPTVTAIPGPLGGAASSPWMVSSVGNSLLPGAVAPPSAQLTPGEPLLNKSGPPPGPPPIAVAGTSANILGSSSLNNGVQHHNSSLGSSSLNNGVVHYDRGSPLVQTAVVINNSSLNKRGSSIIVNNGQSGGPYTLSLSGMGGSGSSGAGADHGKGASSGGTRTRGGGLRSQELKQELKPSLGVGNGFEQAGGAPPGSTGYHPVAPEAGLVGTNKLRGSRGGTTDPPARGGGRNQSNNRKKEPPSRKDRDEKSRNRGGFFGLGRG